MGVVAARTSRRSSLFASVDRNGVAPEAAGTIRPASSVASACRRAALAPGRLSARRWMPQHSAFSAAPAML
jgi:hypothetical protein